MRRAGRFLLRLLPLLPAPLAILALRVLGKHPGLVEQHFSRGFYPAWTAALSRLSALYDAALAERLLPWVVALIIGALLFRAGQSLWKHSASPLLRCVYRLACGIGACYAAFVLLWGVNFVRQPFAATAGLSPQPATVKELKTLCESLLIQAKTLRAKLPEDEQGAFESPLTLPELLAEVPRAYKNLGEQYPWLGSGFAAPKLLEHSQLFSDMQIMGIFIPYTAEALLNGDIPATQLAHTAAHEAAHQHGFAREAEADYVGYLACLASGEPSFAYSGTLTMLRYAALALNEADPDAYMALARRFPESINRDYARQFHYWQRYDTPLAGLVSLTNERYLRTFALQQPAQQRDDVVALLLAALRQQQR